VFDIYRYNEVAQEIRSKQMTILAIIVKYGKEIDPENGKVEKVEKV